jgi:aminopeptidase Y
MSMRTNLNVSATAGVLAASLLISAPAAAQSASCEARDNGSPEKLAECVTLAGVRQHQAALQAIADANNGTRVSGSPGYDASVQYVQQALQAAGYVVTKQDFQFQTFIELAPTILEQVSPPPAGSIANVIMSYSGSGDVTAAVTVLGASPLDVDPGCQAADFAGFPAGNIALIRRSACTFAIKATNAYNAGASAVVIYNNSGTGPINGTLGNGFTLNLPVTSVTLPVGQQLAATAGLVLRVKTNTFRGVATASNVIAETVDGNPNNVVMAGGHLDSVNGGPGIQDNGSGVAALLETAIQMAKAKTNNKVRFAFWGAEESGLVGSTYYVYSLTQEERDRIAMYLNFDMIGSPNHVFFVYDGDDSDAVGAGAGPEGSAAIEAAFQAYFDAFGVPTLGTDFSGRSDYGPFIAQGIPAGGLFTGAEGIKTAAQVALWGGTAGVAYDPCYHQACDTYANVNELALDMNADAVAKVLAGFAADTVAVNGVEGKGKKKSKVKSKEQLEYWGPHAIR